MRKLFIAAAMFAATTGFGQGKTLYDVEIVQVKMGQGNAFEKSWKNHVTKFHNGDDKRYVYEILSGSNAGNFMLVSGPSSLADMDVERTNSAAHGTDYDMTVSPSVLTFSTAGLYRVADTLSYNGGVEADKYITTVYRLKPGKQSDLLAEIKRAIGINTKIKSPSSYNTYVKMWGGSSPEVVIVTNLKDGFKQLDNGFTPMNRDFQNAYVQEYGQAAYDKRQNLLAEICASWETYISKFRKDLSSAQVKK
jgi:hypothetical protein